MRDNIPDLIQFTLATVVAIYGYSSEIPDLQFVAGFSMCYAFWCFSDMGRRVIESGRRRR
jgi:hypothetical protein